MVTQTLFLDIGFVFLGWLLAQLAFNGYEAHVPIPKRLLKFALTLAALVLVHLLIGRVAFYSVLFALAIAISVLHGYWFHHRHRIHWRTAQPRDEYLRLIGKADEKSGNSEPP